MIQSLRLFFKQGRQYIDNLFTAQVDKKYRGFPQFKPNLCTHCSKCIENCPVGAISEDLTVDIGKCQFCGECVRNCPVQAAAFINFHHTGATERETLCIAPGTTPEKYKKSAIEIRKEIVNMFGRSLKLRSVSAGGCNGCELELNATGNVNFDMGRYGIDIAASPRHADGIIISGPISRNMAAALKTTYEAVPDPKIIVLLGTCAISGGIFAESEELDRSFLEENKIDLYIPGCPPHPLTIANAILDFLNRSKR